MTTQVQHLINLSGLSRRQVARAVGCGERTLAGYAQGRAPTEAHQTRIDRVTAAISPIGNNPQERRRAILASGNGPSLLHRLIGENPTAQVIHTSALTVRERLGI
ncbi:hypothetical protein [Curtobacterium sp. MCSS17_016]|uniref:hypothetical protein n=1 Tax=Curtobacterium sp. MCSS17_016 TaxID=2175644 RepID=UPI000DA89EBC|nr:hypothetical protein [Curtobacterium sp. MCSS17_016]WIE81272.1 hypothetical protein DEJ19_018740 [Curtobacterium sp. MCSS17_016]